MPLIENMTMQTYSTANKEQCQHNLMRQQIHFSRCSQFGFIALNVLNQFLKFSFSIRVEKKLLCKP